MLCVCVVLARMHQKDCSMTECLCAYCGSPTPIHTFSLCTAHLHIHSSFSSHILLIKPLILPRPVHPLSLLYLAPPCTFPLSIQSKGERHLSLTPYTPTLPAHKKKKLLVKFNYSRRQQRHEYGGAYRRM